MRRHLLFIVPLAACFLALGTLPACGDDDGATTETNCDDNIDNDGNGLTDCDDPACADVAVCQGPVCGDGVVEGTEECEGTDVGTATCVSEGFDGGTLACNAATCMFDTTACTTEPGCGNGIIDGTEECDGTALDDQTCVTLGHDGGNLTCNPTTCLFDETACTDTVVCEPIDGAETTALDETAGYDSANGYWYYQRLMDVGTTNPVLLYLELYTTQNGAPEVGAHTLGVGDDANYATCIYCPLIYSCIDAQCSDIEDTAFFPTAGTLNIDVLGTADGSTIAGSLEDVNWVEVTIDPDNGYESTPVDGGDCFDLGAEMTFDSTVTAE